MRQVWVGSLTIIVIVVFSAAATVQFLESLYWESESKRNPASDVSSFAWVEKLPFSERLTDYMTALGVKRYGSGHSGANEGLAAFNNSLLKENPCFAELTTRFLDEIRMMDFQMLAKNPQGLKRPKLSDQLSKDSSPPAGFLWQLAMKYADNDSNLAMHLIGVCGHDDAVSVDVALADYNDPTVKERKNQTFNEVMASFEAFKAANPTNSMSEAEFRELLKRSLFKPGCPISSSFMFQPRALGEKADIPDKLKRRVSEAQAPTLGPSALPAKAYHVLAGATSTCLLYQRGIPSFVASEIHERAINAYRSATICRIIQSEGRLGELIADKPHISKEDLQSFARKLRTDASACKIADPWSDPLCRIVESNNRYRNPSISEEALIQRLRTALARGDAGYIVTKSKEFEAVGGCAKIDVRSNLESAVNSMKASRCPSGWPKERCDLAMRVVRTWATDFEWTRAQHLAGERFAREHCRSLRSDEYRLSRACEALDKIRSSNPGSSLQTPGKSAPQKSTN